VLERIEVRGYQSLDAVDIPLRMFTVITGPSSSGKSAVFRAVRLLAFNARGTGYITNGRASCSVAVGDGAGVVRITRSRSRRLDAYHVAAWDGAAWTRTKHTKLAGAVPQEAADALRLTELNFAGQFDMPYLLDVTGTKLAGTLGELTNVSWVLAAAAGASRRRKRIERDLEAARERREALLAQAQSFIGLGERRKAVQAAEEALARLQAASASLRRLEALTARLRAARAAAAGARAEASRREPPSLARLEGLAAREARLAGVIARLRQGREDAARLRQVASDASDRADRARQTAHDALARAGLCPTCGQAVT
jgi:exonuclease SbcC